MDVACSLAMIGRELFDGLRVFTFSNALVEVPIPARTRVRAARTTITGSSRSPDRLVAAASSWCKCMAYAAEARDVRPTG